MLVHFRKKAHKLTALEPDIAVIPESENPDHHKDRTWMLYFNDFRWIGDNKNQGLGIYFKNQVTIEECDWYDPNLKNIKPYKVTDSGFEFVIIPVWANNPASPTFRWIGQVWKFLDQFQENLKGIDCLLLGDTNSNVRWDKPDRWWNHSDVVRILKEYSIRSLYHLDRGIGQGNEPENTFYLTKKQEKGYHIDYVYGSKKFCDALQGVRVGTYDEWIKHSDHVPVVCDFDDSKSVS